MTRAALPLSPPTPAPRRSRRTLRAQPAAALAVALGVALSIGGCSSQPPNPGTPAATSPASASTAPGALASTGPADPGVSPDAVPTTSAPEASQTATAAARTITLQVPSGARLPPLTWSSTADPSVIAAAFAAATWQMDTTTDTSPAQAQQRSAELATATYASTLSQAPQTSGGAAWAELAAHRGWTTVSAQAQASPDAPDTPAKSFRLVNVTITAHGQDGWTSTTLFPPVVTYVVLFSNGAGGWAVNGANTSPA